MNENQTPPEYPQPQPPRRIQLAIPFSKPYATYTLLGLTTVIYLLQLASQSFLGQDWLYIFGAKFGPYIRAGELWRFITPVFLHASIWHIAGNMYALYLYGRGLESRFGRGRFLLLYFLSGFAGNVFSFLLTPNPSIGSSTAVFGLLAAEAVFIIQNRQLLGSQAGRALTNLFLIAALNLFLGFSTAGIDNYGHLGGILGGVLFTWFGGPRWKVENPYSNPRLIDEREGHGALAGTFAVLLFFIPLAALGWIWIVK